MEQAELSRRLGWFFPLRLASYIIVASIVVVWLKNPIFLQSLFIFYSVLTLLFTLSLALEKRIRLPFAVKVVVGAQFLMEIALETGVIFATGNVHSPFSALYILTIISAALAYRLVGTLVISTIVSGSYVLVIWWGISLGSPSELTVTSLKTLFWAQDNVFYSIFLHILIFYLVAFVSGYLAERLSSQDKQLEDASRELRRARLETDDILRHLNSGLLTVDSHGEIIFFNRAAEVVLGYTEEQARGSSCGAVFSERMASLSLCLMDGVLNRKSYPRREISIINREGATIPLGLSTSILTEEDGTLRGVIAIFSDLTSAKKLESKVRSADRLAAVGELSASIAHEIRNPLAAISGSVEVLSKELKLKDENERLMQLIVKESDRLTNILTDFLTYARITPATRRKIELCHLVSETIQLLRNQDSFRETVSIEMDSRESIAYVLGDESLVRQLLMNLAINSCQSFDGKPGRVVFRIEHLRQRGHVDLFVEDNGPGMDELTKSRLFEPFFSTKRTGTGLGLSIVHRASNVLGLKLRVESEAGQGTSFRVRFEAFATDDDSLQNDADTGSQSVQEAILSK